MKMTKPRALTLLATLAVAVAGCRGDTGPAGPAGPGTSGTDGTNGAAPGLGTTALEVSVKSVTLDASNIPSVRFTLQDAKGFAVDVNGVYSVNQLIQPRFAIARQVKDASGAALPYKVLTQSGSAATALSPTALNARPTAPALPTAEMTGLLVENGSGAGDYTYTFPVGGTTTTTANGKTTTAVTASAALDAATLSESHTIWIQIARQTDLDDVNNTKTFTAVNQEFNFVPSGTGTATKREIVLTANCSKCHSGFKPEGLVSNGFHGAGRMEAPFCNVCHNPDRASNPAANSNTFVHRIHAGKAIQAKNVFHDIGEATYPQDLRHCDACHGGAAQGAQAQTKPSRAACGSCHDYVDFAGSSIVLACTSPVTKDASGKAIVCSHLPGTGVTQDDTQCAACHSPAGASYIGDKHIAVAEPDPDNILSVPGTGNNQTNAAYLAAAGIVPPGATQISYDVKGVSAFVDEAGLASGSSTSGSAGGVKCTTLSPCACSTATPCIKVLRPQIVFKLKQTVAGVTTDVVFNAFGPDKTELIDNFVGSPSVYFAFSVPQDNIAAPADFNASQSGYIKDIWSGIAKTTSAGTLTGPDASGYYTITLTGALVASDAKMLTGGVGYTYGLTATPPLVQTNVPGYPYDTGTKVGGLLVPARDVWKVATGFTGRRQVVDNDKCNNCHGLLGANPTFHAGQRNDGPTCSFCHNPNQNNNGWSGNVKDMIHAIHAGTAAGATLPDGTKAPGTGKRSFPYTWHAGSATEGFWEVTFPGPRNYCEACHATQADPTVHTYDFGAAASAAALPNLLWSTEATGAAVLAGGITMAPYVDGAAVYGANFGVNKATGVVTPGADTNLMTSPITAACIACHDSPAQKSHIIAMNGQFYVPRSVAKGLTTSSLTDPNVEACLICHGSQPNAIARIGDVHK
jgi:OmcA/MtrC family decaheme c-type cytochrome